MPRLSPRSIALCLAVTLAMPAPAIVLNDDYFDASGGDPAHPVETAEAGYAKAIAYSMRKPFRAVGQLEANGASATATLLGYDPAAGKSYLLTAAHCVESVPPTATRTLDIRFVDYQGAERYAGPVTAYLPPQRVNRPEGYGGASTDLAVLVAPGKIAIPGADRPMIYCGDKELGRVTSLVGYGFWGIGARGASAEMTPPDFGRRRAGATNRLSRLIEHDHGMQADFNRPGQKPFLPTEGQVGPGDSGGAWWQQHGPHWAIIGATNGSGGDHYGGFSTAARVSRYAGFIRSVYPGVRTLDPSE